ncbi:unannotated protein [freshwater metagenome]|uniref:Unannotated protein n=1 Tax=freshwater metagenome TaxID=449393 RepID=A0A6J5Z0X6_9ZZZZ|nr:hypothetical protein [Actinomycetota bacterium]MSW26551.1 hypothetical protein [Actinomycetota bacterium]MSW34246.1 hypothetical protein [Actinomycetota bacterium]MSX31743.1 hypothetical protein [Actinomycetota bacterium]MSX51937.1 hypothetical protein [Actinomycetota bacterium]
MKRHSIARVQSAKSLGKLLSLGAISFATSVLVIGSMPTSLAASSAPKPKVTAKATPKATAKATSAAKPMVKITVAPSARAGEGAGGFRGRFANLTTAQRSCLAKNGLVIPTPGAARPTARPTGGAGINRGNFDPTKMASAYKACKIALPTGGFNGGGRFDPAKLQAFETCMTKAGFKSTSGFGRYDQSDPDTAVALIKCQKSSGFTMPTRPGGNN